MNQIVRDVGPCRMKVRRDRFGVLASSIVSQQISGAAARTIWQRLSDAVAPDKISADSLTTFEIDELRAIGVSRQKATYLVDLSHKVNSGEVELAGIGRLGDEEVVEQLTKIKGIGVWTAGRPCPKSAQ